ncbi:MAG: prenyltransferase/squalene oxidase repeat-containing protein [Syntrophales bacterium]|jgi:hypothetical protein
MAVENQRNMILNDRAGQTFINNKIKGRAIDYVLARICQDGGFCFYRLEEPSGADTYYALSILRLLNMPFYDEKTVRYLANMQHDNGFYNNIFSAFYAIKSLQILGKKQKYDPWPYIVRCIRQHRINVKQLPVEITSIFKSLSYLIDLYYHFRLEPIEDIDHHITRFILRFRNMDHGFGYIQSTLSETAYALTMLKQLSYSIETLKTNNFIRQCEMPLFGFTDIPGSSLSYIEYMDAGASASQLLSYRPRYLKECADFIINCQNRNGGFARATHSGIATMENTFYAIHALKLLEAMLDK